MGRNAAFGRPQVQDQLRLWWYAKSRAYRVNVFVAVVVGAVVVLLITAAVSRDTSRELPLANATRPQLTSPRIVTTTPTTLVGSLFADASAASLFGLSSTTTTTPGVAVAVAVAPTEPAAAQSRTASPATTAPRAGATTVPNPNVVYSGPPPGSTPATTTPATTTPVRTIPPAVTTPPTTASPTTAPPTTAPPAATTPGFTVPLGIPPLLGG